MFFLEMRTTRVRLPLTTAVPLPGMTIWFLGRTTDVSPMAFELETIGGLNMVYGCTVIMLDEPDELSLVW